MTPNHSTPRQVVVAYDTPSDRRRRRFARLVDDYGARVQRSVFEAWLNRTQLDSLAKDLDALVNPREDSVYIISACARCQAETITMGLAQSRPLPDYWIV
ncbi:MAG: CRISPR-associated endonuclease Cas2 [Planctomycetota bacterium]|nr:MAG: CRISPR-associated endonuclease Cas2 [Planctomycetota bacterium]